ncbi:hypothetical protein [Cypionkella sp. TWP1-2-1b2]|uniref:hypothetical protein n=1 Tax=Cypionkella sp. TWP1-2-1b2 TaxID=2804675 RepID=UPI003CEDB594
MANLVKSARSGVLMVRALLHFKGLANRLSKISGGSRTAPNVSSGYAANLNSPIFCGVQGVGNQLNLDGPVKVTKGRDPVKVHE